MQDNKRVDPIYLFIVKCKFIILWIRKYIIYWARWAEKSCYFLYLWLDAWWSSGIKTYKRGVSYNSCFEMFIYTLLIFLWQTETVNATTISFPSPFSNLKFICSTSQLQLVIFCFLAILIWLGWFLLVTSKLEIPEYSIQLLCLLLPVFVCFLFFKDGLPALSVKQIKSVFLWCHFMATGKRFQNWTTWKITLKQPMLRANNPKK